MLAFSVPLLWGRYSGMWWVLSIFTHLKNFPTLDDRSYGLHDVMNESTNYFYHWFICGELMSLSRLFLKIILAFLYLQVGLKLSDYMKGNGTIDLYFYIHYISNLNRLNQKTHQELLTNFHILKRHYKVFICFFNTSMIICY